jgi:hypothetical protein
MLEADWDLGMVAVAIAIMGGANKEGESNGSDDPRVMVCVSPIPVGFIRGGGTWVFLGSTSI